MKAFLYISFLFIVTTAHSQYITELHTDWDDSFKEWTIIVADSDTTFIEGEMDVTWQNDRSFREYSFRIGEDFGEISQIFANNPTNWELRMGSEIISIRSVWPSDPREWKVSDGTHSIVISTRYPSFFDEWEVRNDSYGEYFMYTDLQGDVRDWIIEDYLDDNISYAMRLATAFIAVYVSSPKI